MIGHACKSPDFEVTVKEELGADTKTRDRG